MLTQQRLMQKLKYDPMTGLFRWKTGKKAGQIAGAVHDKRGFLKVSIDGERHFLQRLAFLYMTGFMPNSNIEHIDGDPGNNRWSKATFWGSKMVVLVDIRAWLSTFEAAKSLIPLGFTCPMWTKTRGSLFSRPKRGLQDGSP